MYTRNYSLCRLIVVVRAGGSVAAIHTVEILNERSTVTEY